MMYSRDVPITSMVAMPAIGAGIPHPALGFGAGFRIAPGLPVGAGAPPPAVGAPVGNVYTSKYNRAYETAVVAGFTDIKKTPDITEGGLVVSPNENGRRAEAFRKMLGTAPPPATNTILITHKPNIIDALGKGWFDVKEGEASVFHPENGSYKLVARVQMDEWARMLPRAK